MCTEPYDSDGQHVHNHHHTRHHKGHNAVGEQGCFGQFLIRTVEALFLFVLSSERTDDRESGQDFTRYEVDVVNQFLHQLKFRHRKGDKQHHVSENDDDRKNNDPFHTGSRFHDFQHTADAKDRSVGNHSQHHDGDHLDLLDIVRASGNQRCGGELIHLRIGESDNPFEYFFAQIAADSGADAGGKQSDENSYHTHQECHADHLEACSQKVRFLNLVYIEARRFVCGNCIRNAHRFYQGASHRIKRFFHAVAHREHGVFIHLSALEHRCKDWTDIHTGDFDFVSIVILFFLLEALQLHMHHLADLLNRHVFKHRRILTGLLCHELFKGILLHRTHLVIHQQCNGQCIVCFIKFFFRSFVPFIIAVLFRIEAFP